MCLYGRRSACAPSKRGGHVIPPGLPSHRGMPASCGACPPLRAARPWRCLPHRVLSDPYERSSVSSLIECSLSPNTCQNEDSNYAVRRGDEEKYSPKRKRMGWGPPPHSFSTASAMQSHNVRRLLTSAEKWPASIQRRVLPGQCWWRRSVSLRST